MQKLLIYNLIIQQNKKKINWKYVKLKGNSSIDFSKQLRALNPYLEKNWQIERAAKTGNPTYKTPSVLVIYRDDQEFVLNDIIPSKSNPSNKFDLILVIITWHSGSPNLTLYSISFGPSLVNIKPAYNIPWNGVFLLFIS